MVKIFISFHSVDDSYREGINGLLQNPNANLNHAPISEREDFRKKGKKAIENYLSSLIQEIEAVVCLIGSKTEQSDWVDYELHLASTLGIGLVALRIQGKKGKLPQIFHSKNIRETKWNRDELIRSLNKAIQYTKKNKVK